VGGGPARPGSRPDVPSARSGVQPAEVVLVLGGAALLAGTWAIVAAGGHVPGPERWAFDVVNGLPGAVWPVVWAPMQLGSLAGSLVVVAAVELATRNHRLALAALVASQAAWWSAKVVKALVARGRPGALLPGVHLREHASGLGYVSGHSAVAFALAAALAPSLPRRWRPAPFALAAVVAVARVYSGAHLPLDTVGGIGLGLLAGTLARWAFGLGGEGLPARAELR
jgi:membrane-associated phospholipid phosphatase